MIITNFEAACVIAGWALVPGYGESMSKQAKAKGETLWAATIDGVRSAGDAIYVGIALAAIGRRGSLMLAGTAGGYACKAVALSGVILAVVATSKLLEEVGDVASLYRTHVVKLGEKGVFHEL